jgi:hypothetical protein
MLALHFNCDVELDIPALDARDTNRIASVFATPTPGLKQLRICDGFEVLTQARQIWRERTDHASPPPLPIPPVGRAIDVGERVHALLANFVLRINRTTNNTVAAVWGYRASAAFAARRNISKRR